MQTKNADAGRFPRPRITRGRLAVLATGIVATATAGGVVASAAVPAFPDNIVVFPERDFVTVEGYQDHVGETATLEVTRGGTLIGSAQSIVAEGDVAFEVNHPGGVCWGAGTSIKVTPDIRPGDKVTLKFSGTAVGDTTTAAASVGPDHASLQPDGVTVLVKGSIGPDVDEDQLEQRIVNPDLTPLVGRRDVRALPGPLAPAPKGGYQSSLEFDGDEFTATYVFDDPRSARIAAGTGVERVLSWQVEDGDANRQGLTISEFGESGGPGMGGCPAGPADQAAPAGSYAVVRNAAKDQIAVNWTPAIPQPGAAAVTGYDVEALAPAAGNGTRKTVGVRTGASATSATIAVDPAVASYDIEVRSLAGPRMGEAFTLASTPPSGEIPSDTTVPKLTFTPALAGPDVVVEAREVKLSSETGADLYYTTDGSSAVTGDLPSDTAKLYDPAKPIQITEETDIHAVAFDRAGNFVVDEGRFKPPATEQPAVLTAPTGLTAAPGTTSVKLTWNPVDGASSYQVTAYNADGTAALPATLQPGETTTPSQTVGGLNGSSAYQFSVRAVNAGGPGPDAAKVRAVTSESVTIGTAKWKGGDFRVTGSSSARTGSITVLRSVRNATTGQLEPGAAYTSTAGAVTGFSAALTAAAAPATGSTYSWRLRQNVPTTLPGPVFVKSSNGGMAGPFTVTNG